MELHNELKKGEYLDANYILCKLIVDRAFIHCISDREVYTSIVKFFYIKYLYFDYFFILCYYLFPLIY